MGEEVTQLVISDAGGDDDVEEHGNEEQLLTSIDETDRAIPASLNGEELIEKCEEKPQAEEVSIKKRVITPEASTLVTEAAHKPQDISIEKSKKWYNISFIHRSGGGSNTVTISSNSCNSRSSNSCENKNSDKMDKRHSWHLNDSAVVEM